MDVRGCYEVRGHPIRQDSVWLQCRGTDKTCIRLDCTDSGRICKNHSFPLTQVLVAHIWEFLKIKVCALDARAAAELEAYTESCKEGGELATRGQNRWPAVAPMKCGAGHTCGK